MCHGYNVITMEDKLTLRKFLEALALQQAGDLTEEQWRELMMDAKKITLPQLMEGLEGMDAET